VRVLYTWVVMSYAALVERHPNCTLEDVKAAVSGHLCRCGTYPNVFKTTLAAAAGWPHNQQGAKGGG
jgi:xanthine dehydrogenase YagT iron-sulfur-binding subunit